MPLRLIRLLVLTGFWVTLLGAAAAAWLHLQLYRADIDRNAALAAEIRAELQPVPDGRSLAAADRAVQPLDAVERALAQPPAVREIMAHAFYEDVEEAGFVAAQVSGGLQAGPETRVAAPRAITALYSAGTVLVRWDPGPTNAVLAGQLAGRPDGLRLAFRVYRSQQPQPPQLQATVPFGAMEWRDRLLPVASARLDYEVWAVLLRDSTAGEVLVGAERSEKVTVESPEHFKLSLIGGSVEAALFHVDVELPSARGTVTVTARPGEALMIGESSSGLLLQSLQLKQEESLTTQRRLLLTSDGSLVLDPITHEPRTTQTQVLMPVKRLVATLLADHGEARVLQADLP
ncbi:MAG: hypothetical protein ACT4PU_13375 [Planctomycetota bacterium]